MTERLRVGIVGAGPWARMFHAPMLVTGDETELAGIWSRRPEPAAELASAFETVAYADYDDFLAHCDAVAFSIAPDAQPGLAIRAVEAGKPVLLEKPLADTVEGAEALVAALESHKVPSLVNLTFRFNPNVRAFIEEASAFEPFGGRVSFISGTLASGVFAFGWRLERGALLDLGPHVLDLAQATLGPITGIQAHGDSMRWTGLLVDHEGGRRSEIAISGTVGMPAGEMKTDVEIYGPNGVRSLNARAGGGPAVLAELSSTFARVCRGEPHPLDARHGLELQRWIARAESLLATQT